MYAATYTDIFLIADTLARSRFLKTIFEDRNLDWEERAEGLKRRRRLGKVFQYANGITHLIEKSKRLFPIPHHWVMDTFTGTGECVRSLR